MKGRDGYSFADVDRLEAVAGALFSYAGLVNKRRAERWKAEARELLALAVRLENMLLDREEE